jgi:site-specific DNA recombinase
MCRIQHTIDLIMAAQDSTPSDAAEAAAQEKIADARRRMARYKALIDADGDPPEIGPWISQARADRIQAEAELRQATAKTRITKDQIEALINTLTDIAATLHDADPAHMADAYDKMGLRLTYHPDAQPRILHAEARPETGKKGKWSVFEVRAVGYGHPGHHRRADP